MSEPTAICPQCGNEIAPDVAACPHCGVAFEVEAPVPQAAAPEPQAMVAPVPETPAAPAPEPVTPSASENRYKEMFESVLATTKTHKWWWVGGGSGVVVVAVLAILVFTGVFGPSGKSICMATLKQAKDFGVIAPEAALSSSSAESTDVSSRKQCSASAGSDTFVLQVDVKNEDGEHKKCKDFEKQADCVKLYSVARSDGMTTYQVREIPPDQTDEALLGGAGQGAAPSPAAGADSGAAAPGAAAPAAAEPGGLDAPTSVDNGGSDQGGQQPQQ